MANLIYTQPEAALEWSSTATNTLVVTSLATGAGTQGDRHDFGALTAHSPTYKWTFGTKFETAPVLGERIHLYLKTWDESLSYGDNDDGATATAVSAEDKLRNLQPIGFVEVDEASVSAIIVGSGLVEIRSRAVHPVIWNATADALGATATEHVFLLQPWPDEVQ